MPKASKNIKLSVIILNYNTPQITEDCIKSILKYTKGLNFEIIVLDNDSSDDSFQVLRKEFNKESKVGLVKADSNLGFAAGNNYAAQKAKGKYILFLNSDTLVQDNVLRHMLEWMEKNPSAGAASCALKNSDGTLQASGGYFPSLLRIAAWMFFVDDLPGIKNIIKPFHPHTPDYLGDNFYTKKRQLDWITGAFILMPKELFDQIGGFDEEYFMYAEDTDICFRIAKLGRPIWYLPKWSIIHLGGASGTSNFSAMSEFKNILLFQKKHGGGFDYLFTKLILKLGALVRMFIMPKKAKIYKNVYEAI